MVPIRASLKDPTWNEYETTLKTYLNKISRPDTEVVVHGMDICSPTIDIYTYEELCMTARSWKI
jgi:hypothetical protein